MLQHIAQTFACGQKVTDIYSHLSLPHIHLFIKNDELDGRVLYANEYQINFFEKIFQEKIKDLNNFYYSRYLPSDEFKNIQKNDQRILALQNSIELLTEEMHDRDFVCIKTQLKNSANHTVGIFGVSFEVKEISLLQLLDVLNLLDVRLAQNSRPTLSHLSCHHPSLTEREKECLVYLLKGLTAKEISRLLCRSHRTIEVHIRNIKNKLNCSRTSELIAKLYDEYPNQCQALQS